MMTIRHASFRRILERGDRRYAEVEAETDQRANPRLLAYFRREGSGHYQLVRVIRPDEPDSEADGFAGARHSEGEDLTMQIFAGPGHGADEDRVQFGRRLLEHGDIREQLDLHLKEA